MEAVRVRVLYFGIVRERLGKAAEEFELSPPATVAGLLAQLSERYPDLSAAVASLRVAVDREYAALDDLISQDAEVAIIPPVSGGCRV